MRWPFGWRPSALNIAEGLVALAVLAVISGYVVYRVGHDNPARQTASQPKPSPSVAQPSPSPSPARSPSPSPSPSAVPSPSPSPTPSSVPSAPNASPIPTPSASPAAGFPLGRANAAMAYDAGNHVSVLFGGWTRDNVESNETWLFDGQSWYLQHPRTVPPARRYHQMAYDAARRQVVMFGGVSNNGSRVLNETWTWDGNDWSLRAPAASPPARYPGAMAWYPDLGQVVMFGGDGGGFYGTDTWGWNGTTWTNLQPAGSPPAGSFPDLGGMAYQPADHSLVLIVLNGRTTSPDLRPWRFDGHSWSPVQPAPGPAPGARQFGFAEYDLATRAWVLFGGYGTAGGYSTDLRTDTWTFDGRAWTLRQPPTSPPGRGNIGSTAHSYDSDRGVVVFFGGSGGPNGYFGDTWSWNGTTWRQLG